VAVCASANPGAQNNPATAMIMDATRHFLMTFFPFL